MQETLDAYGAGVLVNVVQLQAVQPPADVRQAFFDVNAAQQDAVRVQNEAETFASRVVPEGPRRSGARPSSRPKAIGSNRSPTPPVRPAASRRSTRNISKAPAIIRERIFLETMERVFGGIDKVIIDQNGQGQSVVPYLPLTEMQRRPARQALHRPSREPPDEQLRAPHRRPRSSSASCP